jgi:hypothetical protein
VGIQRGRHGGSGGVLLRRRRRDLILSPAGDGGQPDVSDLQDDRRAGVVMPPGEVGRLVGCGALGD